MLKRFVQISLSVSSLLVVGFLPQTVTAAQVTVTWESPEDYRDVRPVNQSRSSFREQTFKQLEAYFEELAVALPETHSLNITVTNLDLAGEVWPASFVGMGPAGNDVRLIQDIDIPRMEFTYSLLDADGQTIAGQEVKLKDMGFLMGSTTRRQGDSLAYEKHMIKEWFDEAFD
ncbi:DUF3016 domain-containing protein [Alteromonas sp. KUL49]|uniref:DUF3016 domain-containing protein n=1 Tax=Alteromonas sp. KUL49 TaxID=2480798 RepID=UPI00102F1BC5|nr:DUF3016 domain-containing protein [Alteromonas sp. KUL49]TAP38957.1 DUF3016 domain-containing protein [Alteromonas sp. KUL49]GEA12397.1 hypothetical protein KUL49_27720 [Alteromonas sp. KUL49]